MSNEEEILAIVRSIDIRLERIERAALPLMTRTVTVAEQAKKAGVSKATMYRRIQRARHGLMIEGRRLKG
jgi:predicted DNA-binding protein (UPF0251 family)